jgi:23S rRNA (uridine2552-2'-O)-methyltransferase
MQVAAQQVGAGGRVVGVDLAPLEPPLGNANAISFLGDLTEPGVAERILAELGAQADVVLSDAAPKLTGVRATDRAREEALLQALEALVPRLLRRGGTLVLKLLDSPEVEAVVGRLRKRFGSLKTVRLRATRQGSAERYLMARDFRG